MEALVSAVIGDIISRAISIMVEKSRQQTTAEEDLQRLHQLLLRISTVIEEAEGRCISNQGMIRQISIMINQMFRGYYLLDSFKCIQKKTNDEEVILVLENMVADMKEFAIFLMSYPRMYRQPYGAYLYLDKYMFGRQMEREQAISFLLQAEPLGGGNLGVLPIVGPGLIGKSTLVERVCDDERVRNHFSLILRYEGNDLNDETAISFRDHCVIKHQNSASGAEKSLVVIELLGDVDEGAWKRLLQTSERCMAHGSKIIVTSRSENMVNIGTTEAIMLRCLSKEAYWYFLKMLLFGSTDPEDRPKLTSIAMELALEMCGSFVLAYVLATLLRENPSARFWRRVLRMAREFTQKNNFVRGEYNEGRISRYAWGIGETPRGSNDQKIFLIHHSHQKGPAARDEIPTITIVDLIFGAWSAVPVGKFEVLCWRSLIPPYYSYVCSCEFVQHTEHRDIES
ncbi:hypothetical protein QYE76_014198 [Lolium multiflorum]|uniref:NB-ARC domain-containing protein n=1 Tax=Lolium multiflorum TaxID=4521 RepID=A0AAD8X5L4_LOLMU|nr:hypothetical protein QYE76_014198 [Lolium multiflorum]